MSWKSQILSDKGLSQCSLHVAMHVCSHAIMEGHLVSSRHTNETEKSRWGTCITLLNPFLPLCLQQPKLSYFHDISLSTHFFIEHLKEKCWSKCNPQLSFKWLMNLTPIPNLFSKDYLVQIALLKEILGISLLNQFTSVVPQNIGLFW